MKKKYAVVIAVLIGLTILSCVKVGKRVTALDLNKIYATTNIVYGYGHLITVGKYPSQNGIGYYAFQTYRGKVWVNCIVTDFSKSLVRGSRQMGATSEPIGDEAFFPYEGSDPRLELAYRRFNVIVYFKDDPQREYRDGIPVFTIDADKKELEQAAKTLDAAILSQSEGVKTETVRGYQVIVARAKDLVSGLFWTVYLIFHPDFHF